MLKRSSNDKIPLLNVIKTNSFFQDNFHIIHDECVKHYATVSSYKSNYTNKSFYSSIKIYITDEEKIFGILAISDELKYDIKKHILTAYRDNIFQNIILLYFGTLIANGNISSSKIITNNLIQKYFEGVDGPPFSEIKRDLISQYHKNHAKYSKNSK